MDPERHRGIKRKRGPPKVKNEAPPRKEKDLAVRVTGKLHHGVKEVHKAAKKAKIFETQKLVKKLKQLRQKNDDGPSVIELEAQLEILKNTNHDRVGETALRTKLAKDKFLRDSEEVQSAALKELPQNTVDRPQTTEGKVVSRLLSSKVLAAEVTDVVKGLHELLQPSEETGGSDEEEEMGDEKSSAGLEEEPAAVNAASSDEEGLDADDLEDEDEEQEVDDAGWESGSVGSNGAVRRGLALDSEADEDDSGLDVNDNGTHSDASSSTAPAAKKHKTAAVSPKPSKSSKNARVAPSESTFLPSLAVGFTRGSNDSDWSDAEADLVDGQRKNRRGQRARKAIWEKKYGKNANHVKKAREADAITSAYGKHGRGRGTASITERGRGRGASGFTSKAGHSNGGGFDSGTGRGGFGAPVRGRPPVGRGSARGSERGMTMGRGSAHHSHPNISGPSSHSYALPLPSSGLSRANAGSDIRQADKPLHPSWEAKKKLKERMSVGMLPSVGTKIKF